MKHEHEFSKEHESEAEQTAPSARQQVAKEFATTDALLRFDAEATVVPPQIEERLKHSIGNLPPAPRRSWWKNLLGQ